ncbi:hypothetical protein SAMN05216184_104132 [Georgenia satyanarayanai]|uniref:Uncharacterized protein n=1 Tax=Georgenia satyanarayanai TaxID=860221 RepID=A0A2Y9A7K1_9MICO|nr:hypothetical protein [Georgenia satyanarayanai]PYG00193.1 hypothetical protein A8987_104132 [Georgenia satyanarayanai]SSA40434.1 hypothetical protein SAMN05216184_104132 [Georgenia satyanarayanai]
MADTEFGHAPDSLYGRPAPEAPMLGRLITLAVAVALCTVGICTADGTIWPAVIAGTGIGLVARLALVMTFTKENDR